MTPRGCLWFDQLGDEADRRRPPLDGDEDADVCVVGGGFTGLWTARWLLAAEPSLRVLVVEAETAGFGASGRNGGWASALFPRSAQSLARSHGRPAAAAMRQAMRAAVRDLGTTASRDGIDCDYRRGGTVVVARSAPQLERARAEVAAARLFGVDELHLLDAGEVSELVAVAGAVGGTWTPDCARVQPAKLVRGLARAVERRGGRVVEGTRALEVSPGRVRTHRGTVRCEHVVVATEAWTAGLAGRRRDVVPVYSLIVATEPLEEATWSRIGLAAGQTFSEHRHLVVYGQRTADGRLVFGGRGAPYHFGSRIRPRFDDDTGVFAWLRREVTGMFPVLDGVRFTHAWGGPLGIPRDWHASVRYDPATRIGAAGGYVGDGVTTSFLAGRTLAELVLRRDTERTRLPWVNHPVRRWEPEPLRWVGVNAGLRLAAWADAEERLTRRPSRLARPLAALTGH
ncbi:MAG: NAD(P)/FAD-dependent oxidoreductase [Actinomycetota bacterium]